MRRLSPYILGTLTGLALGGCLFWLGTLHAQSNTPTPSKCGTQVSGMPQVLQFTDNNCFAVPPGPTSGTCWIEVVNSVPIFQCHDGTAVKISTESWP